MFGPLLNRFRTVALAIVAALVGFGWLPAGSEEIIADNADAIIAGVLAVWSVVAFFRKDDKKEAAE